MTHSGTHHVPSRDTRPASERLLTGSTKPLPHLTGVNNRIELFTPQTAYWNGFSSRCWCSAGTFPPARLDPFSMGRGRSRASTGAVSCVAGGQKRRA